MELQLYNEPNLKFNTLEQILFNRGFSLKEIQEYQKIDKTALNEPEAFGEELLKSALSILLLTIKNKKRAICIVDCDCDGYTSAALLTNYLHKIFPSWVEDNLDFYFHNEKSHGLKDCINLIEEEKYDLVLCPDSSSNDYEEHRRIKQYGGNTIVLDHHLAKEISKDAIVINNQLSSYPNKELSGVAVVWQFCRYIDKLMNVKYANDFLDLVALGLTGDMMSLKSLETKYLVSKGFLKESIKNPFIEYILDKNSFPLSKVEYISYKEDTAVTSIGAAFFIVPFINAVTRCGTIEEKKILFLSMLDYKAFKKIPSTKRGHSPNELELLVLQSVRMVGNVKNRQSKLEKAGVELLENRVQENKMLEKPFLAFLIKKDEILPALRGLIANKFAMKYQRPCAILSELENSYEGSMRGYTGNGIENFLKVCSLARGLLYVEGHENAAGLGVKKDQILEFQEDVNNILSQTSNNICKNKVDFLFTEETIKENTILDIAKMNDFWGKDIERSFIGISFVYSKDNLNVMKSNTLKFNIKNKNISIIKFNATEDEISLLSQNGSYKITAYCECLINEWNGNITPQLIIKDYTLSYYF